MFQPLPNAPSEPMVVDVNSYPVDTPESVDQGGLQTQSEAAGAEEFQGGGRLDRQTSTTSLADFATTKQVRPFYPLGHRGIVSKKDVKNVSDTTADGHHVRNHNKVSSIMEIEEAGATNP